MTDKKATSIRRNRLMALLGLCLLLFASYATVLHGRRLRPRKALTLLGEKSLTPGRPAAFRLVGWDLGQGRPLDLERVELSLARRPDLRLVLARIDPGGSIAELNVRLPDWPPGPARLELAVESRLGDADLSTEVLLEPRSTSRLKLVPPSAAAGGHRAPVLLGGGPAPARGEHAAGAGAGRPDRVVMFPAGGELTSSFRSRMRARVVDRSGRPVPGRLGVGGAAPRPTDADGFVEVTVAERPERLGLAFAGQGGSLSGWAEFERVPTQIDLALPEALVAAGEELTVELRTITPAVPIYIDAWWTGGLCRMSQTRSHAGRARVALGVPAGIDGPLLIRASLDPFTDGRAVRAAAVMVAKAGRPTPGQALARLTGMPAGPLFWDEVGKLEHDRPPGRALLEALLSRVALRVKTGAKSLSFSAPLPRLIDGQAVESKGVVSHRRRVILLGLWMAGLLSLIGWLSVGGLLWIGARRVDAMQRKQARRAAVLACAVLGFVLLGGWLWLWWSASGMI